jgi:hypothetical protein
VNTAHYLLTALVGGKRTILPTFIGHNKRNIRGVDTFLANFGSVSLLIQGEDRFSQNP